MRCRLGLHAPQAAHESIQRRLGRLLEEGNLNQPYAQCCTDMDQLFLVSPKTDAFDHNGQTDLCITLAWHVSLIKTEESSRYRVPMTDTEWQTVCRRLHRQVHLLNQHHVRWLVDHIQRGLEWLDPHMDAYCQTTCPSCNDPCCTGRGIFFNQADLLFHAAQPNCMPPVGQTRTEAQAECRYLGPAGCLLKRTQRPYVCVWFLCEPQMEMVNASSIAFQKQLLNVLRNIRFCRLKLEELFESAFPEGEFHRDSAS